MVINPYPLIMILEIWICNAFNVCVLYIINRSLLKPTQRYDITNIRSNFMHHCCKWMNNTLRYRAFPVFTLNNILDFIHATRINCKYIKWNFSSWCFNLFVLFSFKTNFIENSANSRLEFFPIGWFWIFYHCHLSICPMPCLALLCLPQFLF